MKQTTVRLPDELADEAETVARVHGTSVNQLIVESLAAEIARVRSDADFMSRARRLLERDQEIIERLAALPPAPRRQFGGLEGVWTERAVARD